MWLPYRVTNASHNEIVSSVRNPAKTAGEVFHTGGTYDTGRGIWKRFRLRRKKERKSRIKSEKARLGRGLTTSEYNAI